MTLIDRLKITIPFSYMRLLKKSIGEAETILDLGCGDGSLMELIATGENWKVTGVDIFKKNVNSASKRKVFVKAIRGDILDVVKEMIKKRKKFDVVFCSQVIEHISREKGEKLLKLVDRVAKKRVIMGTPRGFMEQPEVFLGDNPHQVHESGWSEEDFRIHGFKVFGIGFGPAWSEHGLARSYNGILSTVAAVISFIISPVVYYLPSLAAGILCIKDTNEK